MALANKNKPKKRQSKKQSPADSPDTSGRYYTLVVFVPETAVNELKAALFEAGAGRLGNYEHCCWQVLGQGQFKPCSGSSPFIGEQGNLTQVPEYRVEMLVRGEVLEAVLMALHKAHPYEEPAFMVTANLGVAKAPTA